MRTAAHPRQYRRRCRVPCYADIGRSRRPRCRFAALRDTAPARALRWRQPDDGDEQPVPPQDGPGPLRNRAADGVEDHVDIAHYGLELRCAIVDDIVRTELAHEVNVAGGGSPDDVGPAPAGELGGSFSSRTSVGTAIMSVPGLLISATVLCNRWTSVSASANLAPSLANVGAAYRPMPWRRQ
jgi:hypothetical protein